MKTKSTYSLLLNANAEENGRSIFEIAIYGIVVLSMVLSGWQFASTTVTVPGQNRPTKSQETMMARTPVQPPLLASRG